MKKYEFVCKSELKAFLLKLSFVFLFLIVGVIAGDRSFILIFSTIPLVILLYVYYHALIAQYKITKDGVTNRITKLKWDNIRDCQVFYPSRNLLWRHLIPSEIDLPPMICVGCIKNTTIFWQSKFDSVIIPLTQRNLKLIDEYWVNKSPEMQKIIDENIGFPDYIDKWNVWWQ